MKRMLPALVLLVVVTLLLNAPAWANPFISGQPSGAGAAISDATSLPFFHHLLALQHRVQQIMTDQITALQEGHSLAALWGLLLFSFGYGVFHILAPGHGKVIVGSYFLGHHARWRDGFFAGVIMAIGHTVSAIVLVVALNLLLGLSQLNVIDKTRYVELIGYGMIAAIGAWMLFKALRKKGGCGCSCGCGHHHHNDLRDDKGALGLFAVTSLVPCTGSMIVLLFTMTQGVLWAGVLAVLAIALGMLLTVTIIGTAAIFIRRSVSKDETQASGFRRFILSGLSVCAALVVLLTGGSLFLGTLYSLLG